MRIGITLRLVVLQVLLFSLFNSNGSLLRLAVAENAGKTHLYFITNEGCAPCRQVEPGIEALKREGYPVTTVNYDANRQWASQHGVDRTPTVIMISNNKMVGRHAGLIDAGTLRKWFDVLGVRPGQALADRKPDSRPVGTKQVLPESNVPSPNAGSYLSSSSGVEFSTPTMIKGTAMAGNSQERRALQATVRLKVEDPEGTSYATGTVIHSRQGECLVATCGHVFRDSRGTGKITAEYGFESGSPKSAVGELISYDSNALDIGLVAIKASEAIVPVRIANRQASIDRGRDIFSIGCDHGENPTIRRSRIKNRAKYDQAIKYDIYGRPVDGRSGGGLFTQEGELIGICNAAAVEVDEGIYTALDTIYWQLAKVNLDYLFNDQQLATAAPMPMLQMPVDGASNQTLANDSSRNSQFAKDRRRNLADSRLAPIPSRQPGQTLVTLGGGNRNGVDMEVIILVRSTSDPSRTETITIQDPTPQLLDYLGDMNTARLKQLDVARLRTQNSNLQR